MILNRSFKPLALCLALGLTYSTTSLAQGLFAGSKGARVAGRGGAFGAKADDLSAVEYNPAGLTHLGTTVLQLSNRFSYNMVSYQRAPAYENVGVIEYPAGSGQYTPTTSGDIVQFDTVKNQKPWQALDPMLGVGTNFGLKDFAMALVAYAPAGAARMAFPQGDSTAQENPNYLQTGGQRYMMVEREAEILMYALSAAYKYKDIFGVGATAQWIHVPRLNYSLVVAPILFGTGGDQIRAPLDMLTQVEASDPFTFNAVFGAWVRPVPSVEIGLSGQVIPANIRARGTMKIETAATGAPLETTRINAEGVEEPADDVELEIPLPMWARLAARYFKEENGKFKYDIELDLTYHTWSRVQAFDLTSNGLIAALPAGALEVGDVAVEKNWKNGLTVQLGGDYAIIPDRLTLRAGAGYETAIADPSYSHVDFATGHHISGAVGGSVFFGGLELALAYAHRHQLRVTTNDGKIYQNVPGSPCVEPYVGSTCAVQGQPAPTVNNGTYSAFSHFLNLDVIYRFPK